MLQAFLVEMEVREPLETLDVMDQVGCLGQWVQQEPQGSMEELVQQVSSISIEY